jgi:hypothetical protein
MTATKREWFIRNVAEVPWRISNHSARTETPVMPGRAHST